MYRIEQHEASHQHGIEQRDAATAQMAVAADGALTKSVELQWHAAITSMSLARANFHRNVADVAAAACRGKTYKQVDDYVAHMLSEMPKSWSQIKHDVMAKLAEAKHDDNVEGQIGAATAQMAVANRTRLTIGGSILDAFCPRQ